MMETDQAKCSFCGRPQRLVLYLVKGAGGSNICDLCVLEGKSRTAPADTGPWGAHCSFCGRPADDNVKIMLQTGETGICADCIVNTGKTIDKVLGEKAEFLDETPDIDNKGLFGELKNLAMSFEEKIKEMRKSFDNDDIDWNAYNSMAQMIRPMKSKAGLMQLEHLTDALWELESAFQSIRFDDVEKNRPGLDKLEDTLGKLIGMVEKEAQ